MNTDYKGAVGMAVEEWRAMPRYPEYEISNYGRVRRMTYLTPQTSGRGYLTITLTDSEGQHCHHLHRMVAEAGFLGPKPFPDAIVNHLDGKKDNPAAWNLEWNTQAGNVEHARILGLYGSKLSWPQVRCIRHLQGRGAIALANSFGVSPFTVRDVIANRRWKLTNKYPQRRLWRMPLQECQRVCIRLLRPFSTMERIGRWFGVHPVTIWKVAR